MAIQKLPANKSKIMQQAAAKRKKAMAPKPGPLAGARQKWEKLHGKKAKR